MKTLKLPILAAAMFSLASCMMEEKELDRPDVLSKQTDVLLRLRTKGGFSTPQSRGLTYADENTIDNVYVLVFDGSNKLTSIEKAASVTDNTATETSPSGGYSGGGDFSVTLPPSKGASTSKLVVLANAEEILDARGFIDPDDLDTPSPMTGSSYAAVSASLYDEISVMMYHTAPHYTEENPSVAMWGETGQLQISPSTTVQPIELTRAVARIDVGLGVSPIYAGGESEPWSWDGIGADGDPIPFQLLSVHLVRADKQYAILPDAAKSAAGLPTVPATSTKFAADMVDAAKFSADINGDHYTTQSLYVPEADIHMGATGTSGDANHTNRMAVVVGGLYNGSPSPSYYRIDFARDGSLIDVLRNHIYQFNIQKVSGEGYPDVITAYESNAMNMTVDVIEWDEESINDIEFSGNYYFGIEKRKVDFPGTGYTARTVTFKTNVTDFSMSLGGTVRLQAGGVSTYTSPYYSYALTNSGGDLYTLTITPLSDNASPTEGPDREETWSIGAKQLEIDLTVDQEWSAPLPMSYLDAMPGVIGYVASGPDKGKLTLRGSSKFAGETDMEELAELLFPGEGLYDAPVYVAFFKYGSLIATGSANRYFSSDDVIAAPMEYDNLNDADAALAAVKARVGDGDYTSSWENVPYRSIYEFYPDGYIDNWSTPIPHDYEVANGWTYEPAEGLGDPCAYYFGNGWHVPTVDENLEFMGVSPDTYSTYNSFYVSGSEYDGSVPFYHYYQDPDKTALANDNMGFAVFPYSGYGIPVRIPLYTYIFGNGELRVYSEGLIESRFAYFWATEIICANISLSARALMIEADTNNNLPSYNRAYPGYIFANEDGIQVRCHR